MQKEMKIQNARGFNNVVSPRIEEIARPLLKNSKGFGLTKAARAETATYFLVAKEFDYETMSHIAGIFSAEDIIVEYKPGTNFVTLKENPMPTPAKVYTAISRIPATLDECLEIVDSRENFSANEVVVNGHRRITVVCHTNNCHGALSELAYELSHRGLAVEFHSGCNFILVGECLLKDTAVTKEADTEPLVAVGWSLCCHLEQKPARIETSQVFCCLFFSEIIFDLSFDMYFHLFCNIFLSII